LFPSLDRFVAFLAVYTEHQALDRVVDSLRIDVVRSKLNTREIALTFDAGSGDRLDRVSEVARLTGGFTFTGTTRHYVQYRDTLAPFGYDVVELSATDADLVLYHSSFSQAYAVERTISLASLLLKLMPYPDPTALPLGESLWVLAEEGLGQSVLSYLIRSRVGAEATVIEWPPSTAFDDRKERRWLFRIADLPPRMLPLLTTTPGITAFLPTSDGAAVQVGFRHPITLLSCKVFEPEGLVLFRGHGERALSIDRLPVLASVRSLAKVEFQQDQRLVAGALAPKASLLELRLRLVPAVHVRSTVVCVLVPPAQYSVLRHLMYVLDSHTLATSRVAFTELGAFVMNETGIEAVPLGTSFRRVHASVLVPAGMDVLPAVDGEVIFSALGAPRDQYLFLRADEPAVAVAESAFIPLQAALLSPEAWAAPETWVFESLSEEQLPILWLEPLGVRPLRRAKRLP
jgi:hypothetical protein